MMELVSMEVGLLSGALLIFVGLCLSIGAVLLWKERGFGALQPSQTLRWVIPGGLCISLGCELILASFFLGVIQLDTRSDAQ